ncbi:MAG: DUF4367 domain-containing protein, partial [Gorillibacterium sp.]|nr:DUF4367 domain-containing protein [Gorillibacterium sp.]
ISLGHITASQMGPLPEGVALPVPAELKGKIFTKEGSPIEFFTSEKVVVYTADGEEIVGTENGEIITKAEAERTPKTGVRKLFDSATLNEYVDFKVGLPSYLPEGYSFDRAEQFVDKQGKASPKYMNLYFRKANASKEIIIDLRLADKETAYIASTSGTMESATVNGVKAIILNGHSIDWEADGVLYGVTLKGKGEDWDKAELIKIAESIK